MKEGGGEGEMGKRATWRGRLGDAMGRGTRAIERGRWGGGQQGGGDGKGDDGNGGNGEG